MGTHVNRIRLPKSELPPHFLAFQFEDALRTSINDHGRLVVIRQLRVGPASAKAGPAPVVARAWQDVCDGLCHAANEGAAAQNAIWFHDREEAVLLLLEWRLRGRDVSAWFWQLAVPEGVALPVADWAVQALRNHLTINSVEAAVRLLVVIASHANAAVRMEVIEKLLVQLPVLLHFPSRGSDTPSSVAPRMPAGKDETLDSISALIPIASIQANKVFLQLPAPLRRILECLSRSADQEAFAAEICAAVVSACIPVRQVSQAYRKKLAVSLLQILQGCDLSEPSMPAAAKRPAKRPYRVRREVSEAAAQAEPTSLNKNEGQTSLQLAPLFKSQAASAPLHDQQVKVLEASPNRPFAQAGEMATAAAGLYLTLLPLWHLDWPCFLSGNRVWIEHKPTAQLIAFFARHHKLSDDPLGRYWLEQSNAQRVAIPTETLAIWRIALDRWLRRRVQMNLANLVSRRGWVDIHHETVRVRFRSDAIDIRLRRLALDRDPGWLDWLGQSVRYIYCDHPVAFSEPMA